MLLIYGLRGNLTMKRRQKGLKNFFTGVDYIEWTDEECEIIRELLKTETQ